MTVDRKGKSRPSLEEAATAASVEVDASAAAIETDDTAAPWVAPIARPPGGHLDTELPLEKADTLISAPVVHSNAVARDTTVTSADQRRARPPVADATPRRISRFEVLEELGRGGMGVVYAARDPHLDRRVAVKLVLAERNRGDDDQPRLLREAQAMARVSHPNIVTVHEVGWYEGQLYIAMELVEGYTLRDWLRDCQPTTAEILDVFTGAGRGLAVVHEAGMVHRDFKPQNVLIGKDGRPRVSDFGLARGWLALAEDLPEGAEGQRLFEHMQLRTETGVVCGTPAYMAPEQHTGQPLDARSDQFSFCVALYEGLFEKRPFAGQCYEELVRAVCDGQLISPDRLGEVPQAVWKAIERGLQPTPGDRHESMDALLEVIGRTEPAHSIPRRSRRLTIAAALAAALALAAAAATWQLTRQRAASPSPQDAGVASVHRSKPVIEAEEALASGDAARAVSILNAMGREDRWDPYRGATLCRANLAIGATREALKHCAWVYRDAPRLMEEGTHVALSRALAAARGQSDLSLAAEVAVGLVQSFDDSEAAAFLRGAAIEAKQPAARNIAREADDRFALDVDFARSLHLDVEEAADCERWKQALDRLAELGPRVLPLFEQSRTGNQRRPTPCTTQYLDLVAERLSRVTAREVASQIYRQAEELYSRLDFAKAALRFVAANRVSPASEMYWNTSRSFARAGDLDSAIRYARRYLEVADNPQRKTMLEQLEAQRRRQRQATPAP